jgi:transcriptional regulator with XRE-family HTH domain
MLSGLSRFTISKIEARSMEPPHASTLRRLAMALGRTVEDLWQEREDRGNGQGQGQGHPGEAGAVQTVEKPPAVL